MSRVYENGLSKDRAFHFSTITFDEAPMPSTNRPGAIAAIVATVAITSGGYTAQRTDLNDASVWVANGGEQYIGRANTEVLELDTVVESDGADIELVSADRPSTCSIAATRR